MNHRRTVLDEDNNVVGHFDPDHAQAWEETTTWNGNNHISDATGSQWEHETLYKTTNGRYILLHWSQWQGSIPHYKLISEDAAGRWLMRCGYHDDVPAAIAEKTEL